MIKIEKSKHRTRDIQFYSAKNDRIICVHSPEARAYAGALEEDETVLSYETNVPLDLAQYSHVNPVDLRAEYLQTAWASDFRIVYADGRVGIRELVKPAALQKKAVIEKLELSRRYWAALDAAEWKVVVIGIGGKEVAHG